MASVKAESDPGATVDPLIEATRATKGGPAEVKKTNVSSNVATTPANDIVVPPKGLGGRAENSRNNTISENASEEDESKSDISNQNVDAAGQNKSVHDERLVKPVTDEESTPMGSTTMAKQEPSLEVTANGEGKEPNSLNVANNCVEGISISMMHSVNNSQFAAEEVKNELRT